MYFVPKLNATFAAVVLHKLLAFCLSVVFLLNNFTYRQAICRTRKWKRKPRKRKRRRTRKPRRLVFVGLFLQLHPHHSVAFVSLILEINQIKSIDHQSIDQSSSFSLSDGRSLSKILILIIGIW